MGYRLFVMWLPTVRGLQAFGLTMRDFFAIDPGDQHCGYCVVNDWLPITGETVIPSVLFGIIEQALPHVEGLVIEEYRILDGPANQGTTGGTIEVIGVLKYLAVQRGKQVVMQQTGIKKPMKGWLLGHDIKSVIPRRLGELRVHAVDAELHAWHHILKDDNGEWRKQNV